MKINKLIISDSFFSKVFEFEDNYNLIYSKQNSVGKTTLLRAILYSLGFNIPNTKNFKFENYSFELHITTDANKKLVIRRNNLYCYVINDNKEEREQYFSLPADVESLHSIIFENFNSNILENILGAMYLDQEKGWTLLNRGVVIGSIRFNLEKFIQGIAQIDCSDLYEELSYIEKQIKKYKSMLTVADYQKQINSLTKVAEYDSFNDKLEKEIAILETEKAPLTIEQNRLKSVLNKNEEFKKYITNMRLHVVKDNIRIPVNEKTIEGFEDNLNYISAKINTINSKISIIDKKIKEYTRKQKTENLLFQTETETIIDKFDADVSKINIDYISVQNMITKLEKQRYNIKTEITQKTKGNNELITKLHKYISNYAKEMGIDEKYVSPTSDYIFTSDLKSLSGAIFHKIVFAFKLAYIRVLEEYLNIFVPIILDSPRGKEVDDINVHKMIEILKRDFSNHQLFIASIYNYNLENINIIEIKNCLLENFV